jgi:hypothetical protein
MKDAHTKTDGVDDPLRRPVLSYEKTIADFTRVVEQTGILERDKPVVKPPE